jgi:hypothetical protein
LIFIVFLLPVAMYLVLLALLNRSRHPVMVPGPWDVVGVLFAVSGFLLIGGPAILTSVYEQWRVSWLLGETRFLEGITDAWPFWLGVWILYWALIVCGSGYLLFRRKNQTSIYNIEPVVFMEVLSHVLDRLGLGTMRRGPHRLLIHQVDGPGFDYRGNEADLVAIQKYALEKGANGYPADLVDAPSAPWPTARPTGATFRHWVELDILPFVAMRHITLRWSQGGEVLREELETELVAALAQVRTRHNPVGTWLLSLASSLLLLIILGVVGLLVFRILRLR